MRCVETDRVTKADDKLGRAQQPIGHGQPHHGDWDEVAPSTFGSKCDMRPRSNDVRFTPQSRHQLAA